MKRAKLFLILSVLVVVAFTVSSCFPIKGTILLLAQRIGWEPGKPVVIEANALLFMPDQSSNYQWSVDAKPQGSSNWISRNDLVKVIPSDRNSKVVVYLPVYENSNGEVNNGKSRLFTDGYGCKRDTYPTVKNPFLLRFFEEYLEPFLQLV